MSAQEYDVLVIGGGPGGYVAAIKAAQLGLKTGCIEKRPTLGGTCLNVGCIPSKALLNATEKFHSLAHFAKFGIEVEQPKVNLTKMMQHKEGVVSDLTKGIDFLFKKNKVDRFVGTGTIQTPTTVEVTPEDGGKPKLLTTKNIIIATGSTSADLPGIEIDEKRIVSSTGALSLSKVPKKMVVIGGGYIGLEMASVWARLGTKVTVVEYADGIIPMMDHEVAAHLQKCLEKQGITFALGTKVMKVEAQKNTLNVHIETTTSQSSQEMLETDIVLVSVGRTPYTKSLGLENVGITPNERGIIMVNDHYATSVPGIFAIGDVIPGPMLAHKAEEEAVAVVETIAGQSGHVNYGAIPGVIYTQPEVASVGKTEQELKQENRGYSVGKFSFAANSRAKAIGETEGFVKLLTDATTNELLGAHIISADAGTLISECVLAMEYRAAGEDIARTCHPHPTTSEAIKEAALATYFKALHS